MQKRSHPVVAYVVILLLIPVTVQVWSYSNDYSAGNLDFERARSIEKKQIREAIQTFEIPIHALKALREKGVNFDQVIFSYQTRSADSPTYETFNCKPIGYAFFCSNNNDNARNHMLYDKIEVLLEMGCDPQQFKGDILFSAVMADRVELARMLLQRGIKKEKSLVFSHGAWQPLLHLAAAHASKEMVELLLSYGFDKNDKDRNGATALSYAINPYGKKQDIIDLLSGAETKTKTPPENNPGTTGQVSGTQTRITPGLYLAILLSGIFIVLGIWMLIKTKR